MTTSKKAGPERAALADVVRVPKRKRGADDPAIVRRRSRYSSAGFPPFDIGVPGTAWGATWGPGTIPSFGVGPVLPQELVTLARTIAKSNTLGGRARRHLCDVLNHVGIDPVVVASPVHLAFVQLVQDLLHESEPDDSLDVIFEPLFSLRGESTARLATESAREFRQQAEANNLDAVLLALLSLEPRQRQGRDLVGVIKRLFANAEPPIEMGDDTIRKHLKALRGEMKAE